MKRALQPGLMSLALVGLSLGCNPQTGELEMEMPGVIESGLENAPVSNAYGKAASYSPLGPLAELRETNAFFKDMGTNGRTCASCHGEDGGWTPSHAARLFEASNGEDPLFVSAHDVGTCPEDPLDTLNDKKRTMSPLLERANARAGGVRPKAEWDFEVTRIKDPYGCEQASPTFFYNYREPNPVASMSQKSSFTWAPVPQPDKFNLAKALMIGATTLHAQTTYIPTDEEQTSGAEFMLNIYFAQIEDAVAGRLDEDGALGGPVHLANQEWYDGINHASTGGFDNRVFTIYDAWLDIDPSTATSDAERKKLERRLQIATGQEIFNSREFGNGRTCSGCHNSPNVGSRSVYGLFDIGTVDIPDPDLTTIYVRNKHTGEERVVTNLGLAAATGKFEDIGKMKAPIMRGLAQRAPYFHSGQAKTLDDVVRHYDKQFDIGLTGEEQAALVAFLSAL